MSEANDTQARIVAALQAYGMQDGTFELRILGTGEGVISGCFDDVHKAAEKAAAWTPHAEGVYFTPNPINPILLGRGHNRVIKRAKNTTSDTDIVRRRWFLIDFDPKRPSGISSTDAEHEQAIARAKACRDMLREKGWPEGLLVDSGNGAHLCYRVDLPNDKEVEAAFKGALAALDFMLSDDVVAVDRTTYNAARIWKVPGTKARKGDPLPDRPHRWSAMLEAPSAPELVSLEQIQALAALAPNEKRLAAPPLPPPARNGLVARETGSPGGAFNLDDWIARYALPVVSSGPWGSGGRKWVLSPCPWNADHTNAAAYIVQHASGAIAAGCHHNGCTDRDWHALRDLYEPGFRERRSGIAATSPSRPSAPAETSAPFNAADLPEIDVGDKNIPRVAGLAWEAVTRRNDPPQLFRRVADVIRVEPRPSGQLAVNDLNLDRARHELVRAARFVTCVVKKDEIVKRDAYPPDVLVRDMLASREPPLPSLDRMVTAPVFASDGRLQTTPGYHALNRTYYHDPRGLVPRPVPDAPTREDITAACGAFRDLVCDFPFKNEAAFAHAFALFLLPFARDLIDGPTPLHIIGKPTPGTGGTLLAQTLVNPMLGSDVSIMTEARAEEEWRKRITASLAELPPIVLIDNLGQRVISPSLAAALTSRTWKDRPMSLSKTIEAPVRCVWIATGNTPDVSDEIARRTIYIELDPKTDQPWLRTGFRHPDLRAYVSSKRQDLMWAAHVVIRAWIVAGRPAPADAKRLGMFEGWSDVIGGILAFAGIPGFLSNLKEFYERNDTRGESLRNFVTAWWMKYEGRAVSARELWDLCQEEDGLLDFRPGNEQAQRGQIGYLLRANRDRRFGHFTIRKAGAVGHGARWSLESALEQEVA